MDFTSSVGGAGAAPAPSDRIFTPLEKTAQRALGIALPRIHANVGWERYNKPVQKSLDSRPEDFVVAESEDRIVGYVVTHQEDAESYHVDYIATESAEDPVTGGKRKGVGLGLMMATIGKVRGFAAASLTLNFRGNPGLKKFYSRVGEEGEKRGLLSGTIIEDTGTKFLNADPRWRATYLLLKP